MEIRTIQIIWWRSSIRYFKTFVNVSYLHKLCEMEKSNTFYIIKQLCSDESTARLTGQKITSFKDNEMKKEIHYKSDLVDSLISNIPNKCHFIEIKRSNKRLSTTTISKKSQSSLPTKKIKVEDIKVEKADSGWVQSFFLNITDSSDTAFITPHSHS